MPGNKRPRKRKARNVHIGAAINPAHYAMESVRPPDQKFVERLRFKELGAIEAFATGRGNMHEWEVLASMVNRSEYLGEHGCGPEAVPVAERAAAGIMAAVERHSRGLSLALDGPTIQALREVREYMDLQFQSLSVKELEAHFAAMRREQRQIAAQMT